MSTLALGARPTDSLRDPAGLGDALPVDLPASPRRGAVTQRAAAGRGRAPASALTATAAHNSSRSAGLAAYPQTLEASPTSDAARPADLHAGVSVSTAATAPGSAAPAPPLTALSPALPTHAETSLPPAARLRASLTGLLFGTFAITAAFVGGSLIAAGPFHTSLGSLA